MPNIKFNYLYRDGYNYKNYGFVIFANRNNITLAELETRIRSRLIDDTYFYAKEWQLADLCFDNLDIDNDPTWHEFESLQFTDEPTNTVSFDLQVQRLPRYRSQ